MQNLVRQTLVAMATTFALGAESNRLPACLYVSLSVCLSRKTSNRFFFFCFSMRSSHFWPLVLHDPLYKTLFFAFSFRPPNAQNLLPKIWHKIDYKSACMACRYAADVWAYQGVFGDGRFNGTMQNVVCGADPCCHSNDICARRGV